MKLQILNVFFASGLQCSFSYVMKYTDISNKGSMINGFALVANIGITTAWGPVQTMTIELYPTVIR